MRRFLVLGICAPLCLSACGTEAPERRESDVVAKVYADEVTVEANYLRFPADLIDDGLRAKMDAFTAARKEAKAEGRVDALGKPIVDAEPVLFVDGRASDAVLPSGEANPNSKNPLGYSRRALSYYETGENIVIFTDNVTVEDVLKEMSKNGSVNIVSQTAGSASDWTESDLTTLVEQEIPVIDASGLEIFREGDVAITLSRAEVDLIVGLGAGIEVNALSLESVTVELEGSLFAQVAVAANASMQISQSIEEPVFSKVFPVGSLGPVPLALGVDVVAECSLDTTGAVTAEVGARLDDVSLIGGLKYTKDDGIEPVGGVQKGTVSVIGPDIELAGDVGAGCALKPRLSLLAYDIAGPYVEISPRFSVVASAEPLGGSVVAGIDGRLGGTLNLFGSNFGNVDLPLFSAERTVWSSEDVAASEETTEEPASPGTDEETSPN